MPVCQLKKQEEDDDEDDEEEDVGGGRWIDVVIDALPHDARHSHSRTDGQAPG